LYFPYPFSIIRNGLGLLLLDGLGLLEIFLPPQGLMLRLCEFDRFGNGDEEGLLDLHGWLGTESGFLFEDSNADLTCF
jgi:hypothetical protein